MLKIARKRVNLQFFHLFAVYFPPQMALNITQSSETFLRIILGFDPIYSVFLKKLLVKKFKFHKTLQTVSRSALHTR